MTQRKTRCLIESKRHPGNFLKRSCDGLTADFDAAIRFRDEAEASEWLLNGIYSPEDKENYTYALIEITTKRKEIDDERMQTSLYAGMDGRTEAANENG